MLMSIATPYIVRRGTRPLCAAVILLLSAVPSLTAPPAIEDSCGEGGLSLIILGKNSRKQRKTAVFGSKTAEITSPISGAREK